MSTYTAPTRAQVADAMRRITKSQLARAFFEGIQNPLWVRPLAEAGAFRNPPEPVSTGDGLIRESYWPQLDFLVRVADQAPQDVVDVLLTLKPSGNSWVRRAVFEIGAKVPAEYAVQLQPLLKAWASSTGFGWRTDPRHVVAYCINLLEGGQRAAGTWTANVVFKPAKPTRFHRPQLAIEEYWYETELPKLVAALGNDGLEMTLSWLVGYERHSGHLSAKGDLTYFRRDSIRHNDDLLDKVEQSLINAVRDLAIDAMLTSPGPTTDLLLNTKMILGRKIAMFSLGEALLRVSSNDARVEELTSKARELLFDEASVQDSCRIDYAELARAVAQTNHAPLAELTEFLQSGPRVDEDRLRQWVAGDGTDENDIDDRVRDYISHWRHRWLSAIGIEALAALLQAELAELDARFGLINNPLTPSQSITFGWTGPNSPISQEEMAVMSAAELTAHLESWHATGDRWEKQPSHEGQGRELTSLLTTNPQALSGVDSLVRRLRPIYLRAVLHGWEAALKAGLELDWDHVATVESELLAHSDRSDFPAEGGQWDDDVDYRPAKHAAVGLLEELAQRRDSITIPDAPMETFARSLIAVAREETAWQEYLADDHKGSDPLTTSLNWQWPIALRGLIYLMARGTQTRFYQSARSALEDQLQRTDPYGSSRAVVGEGLGRLADVDREWVTSKSTELFGAGQPLTRPQQIALTTAMAVHYYHPSLYELLSDPMVAAIDSTEPIVAGWDTHTDPLQRIGEWVIDGIIRGHRGADDPVAAAFFARVPAKIRGEAIGHIAWTFMHADSVDDEIRDRFADLWDERVAHVRSHPSDAEELSGFYWFVKSHKFRTEWWLPRLAEASRLDPNLSSERHMIGKEIASAADVDPRSALDVLKSLLDARAAGGMLSYDLTQNAVPMVIARAIASGDETLQKDAVGFMNHLGEQGHLSLETEVNKVLDGSIAESDVDD